MEITKEDCEAYEKVRTSGITNMFDVSRVCQLSCLDRDKVMEIMKKYEELNEKWGFRKQNGNKK